MNNNCSHYLLVRIFLCVFVVWRGCCQDLEERWITRPPTEYEFTYVVLLVVTKTPEQFCSGTLVTDSWVITAAFCIYLESGAPLEDLDNSLDVYAGVKNRDMLNDTSVQKRHSTKVRFPDSPEECSYRTLAIVKVDTPFKQDKKLGVQSSVISRISYQNTRPYRCKSGSYGDSDWEGREASKTMKKLDILTKMCNCSEELEEVFPKAPVNKWLCGTSAEVVGFCKGDFGMGMICDGVLQAIAVGLVRFTNKSCQVADRDNMDCDHKQNEGLFVDICYYLDWLREYVPSVHPSARPCQSFAQSQVTSNLSLLFLLFHILFHY